MNILAGTGVQKIEMVIDILKTVFGDIQKIESRNGSSAYARQN